MSFYYLLFICCLINAVIWSSLAQRCPQFEEPTECSNACQTCEGRNGRCIQPLACFPGCNCRDGFFRNNRGVCVPPIDCDTCGPNEVPSNCTNPCNTCDQIGIPCQFLVCNEGCNCRAGYTRYRGDCIPQSQCPIKNCDGPNEVYSNCANPCNTCKLKDAACDIICEPGCDCRPGFIRSDEGICIPKNQCPGSCGPYSKFSTCASPCPRMCGDKEPFRICPAVCVRGCVCDRGYVKERHRDGNCILESQCPSKGY